MVSVAEQETRNKLTADGDTYYGRAEDFGPRYLKHYGIEPAHEPGFTYSSTESAFEYTSNKPTYRYSYVRDHPFNWEGRTDAYSEAGINEKAMYICVQASADVGMDMMVAAPNARPMPSFLSALTG